MRIFMVALTASMPLVWAAPAHAGEAYVEATGGISWNREESAAVAGFAGGYDVDLDEKFFVGVESIAEKELTDGTRFAWGVGGRIGTRMVSGAKIYVGSNWQSKDCKECASAVGLTAGWEQDLSEKIYVKIEYKHLLIGEGERDKDVGLVGIGVKL